jgi:hypothetical protein
MVVDGPSGLAKVEIMCAGTFQWWK